MGEKIMRSITTETDFLYGILEKLDQSDSLDEARIEIQESFESYHPDILQEYIHSKEKK